jgi:hypothetical protein
MERAVTLQLRNATAEEFAQLQSYYQRRGGPGLALLREELRNRNLPDVAVIRPMYP